MDERKAIKYLKKWFQTTTKILCNTNINLFVQNWKNPFNILFKSPGSNVLVNYPKLLFSYFYIRYARVLMYFISQWWLFYEAFAWLNKHGCLFNNNKIHNIYRNLSYLFAIKSSDANRLFECTVIFILPRSRYFLNACFIYNFVCNCLYLYIFVIRYVRVYSTEKHFVGHINLH